MSAIVPIPKIDLNVRVATMDDFEFIDRLQKQYSKNLGFMPKTWVENKAAAGQVLVAVQGDERVGYVIGQDRYFKRDDVGIVYQIAISPEKQRGFIGAALLKAMFDRSAYGCRLFCCWCAQDLEANRFWEAMGFVPLAFRAGSEKKSRVHIFWQKKIRGHDDACNWWYPHKTDQGVMRADRLTFPIPPNVHWSEVQAVVVPKENAAPSLALPPGTRRGDKKKAKPVIRSGMWFASPEDKKIVKAKREPKPKVKIDPKLVSASRELRDRYLEQVNETGFRLESAGKYELTRQVAADGKSVSRQIGSSTTRRLDDLPKLLVA